MDYCPRRVHDRRYRREPSSQYRAGHLQPRSRPREYVQNACDAYAELDEIPEHASISIRIVSEDTITVQDNGIGMGLKEIKDSKKIAGSPKAGLEGRTGFRGIGIWAGLQACDKL